MAVLKSDHALGKKPTPVPNDAGLAACRASFTLTGDVAAGDLFKMMYLPANCVPVDLILDYDDMDTGASGTVSVGLGNDTVSNGTYTEATDLDATKSGGAVWLTAESIQAAGAERADTAGLRAMSRCAPDATRARPVFIKVVGEPVAAASQVIGLTLMYRAA